VTDHDDFWASKQSAAVLKHAVLSSYIYPFATMTGSGGRTVWFIDAYAGPGRYAPVDGESVGEPGSPMIAMDAMRTLSEMTNPRTLKCVFIDRDKAHVTSLEAIAAERSLPTQPLIVLGDAQIELPRLIAAAGADPVLTFLDPYGTALPYDLLMNTLLRRPVNGMNEILLNLHITSLARIGALLGRQAEMTPGDRKTLDRLDLFLGHGEWRAIFAQTYRRNVEGSATAAALEVAADYRERVRRDSGYDSFPIDIRRAETHVPLFQLTLFYRSGVAAYKFADAASIGHAHWREFNMRAEARTNGIQYQDALLADDYSDEVFRARFELSEKALLERLTAEVEHNIVGLLAERRSLMLDRDADLKAIFGDTLGIAGEKHLRTAWDRAGTRGVAKPRDKRAKLYGARIERAAAAT
jgi:three-Cys-motif partner protein